MADAVLHPHDLGHGPHGSDSALIKGDKTYSQVTEEVFTPIEKAPPKIWFAALFVTVSMLGLGAWAVTQTLTKGIGTWGLNKTVGWAFDITNFVFWVGIGHAGTLISAILYLFRQHWRTSINRAAEAMTIFAVMCAGLFPIIHMGRPWVAHWALPLPNLRGPLWVNFRSPLLWDVFAISTYFIISAVFWYVGLLPDLATARDRAENPVRKRLFTILSLGWNGANRTWKHYESVYGILAGLATPLVVSVHTIVSMDFATSVIPGWHATLFPPYFVVGAVFSGFAMVLTLMIVARKVMGFEDYITLGHLDAMCKVVLTTGSIVALAYATEFFVAWYSGNPYERYVFLNRAMGPFKWAFWSMVACNVITPQFFWSEKIRRSPVLIFILCIFVNIGMWFERFVIIVTSLHRDYLPSSWTYYRPTFNEAATLIGSFGLFLTLFLVFCRVLPMIAASEVKGVLKHGEEQ
jgi:molybdopterin-containing oxidoreductase family membrane subunit